VDLIFDPAAKGAGFADIGPFGLPWVPFALYVAFVVALWIAFRIATGRSIRPTVQPRPPGQRRKVSPWFLAVYVPVVAAVLLRPFVGDPVAQGSVFEPGLLVRETRYDGIAYHNDDESDHRFTAPRHVYRVGPGQSYGYFVSVRNSGPLPFTLLGLPQRDAPANELLVGTDSVIGGLGLLRDPTVVSARASDVVPFHPVDLAPGDEVVILVGEIAGDCADPSATLPPRPADPLSYEIQGISFIYEMLATRSIAWISLPFETTVPTRPGCVVDPFLGPS
jgi:hypothetical protein